MPVQDEQYPLFREYPRLINKIRRIPIGDFPTPVHEAPELAEAVGVGRLFIKRDDLTHCEYGGNKIRKLEFLLADAERRHSKRLLTFGGIGSNHCLATTIHGANHGFPTTSCLVPQPVTEDVRKNLLVGLHYGEELVLAQNTGQLPGKALEVYARQSVSDMRTPYIVPPGGSSALGATGYINAVFELRDQIEAGECPEPDRIFVAVGTCGTAAGLEAGCKAAGLKTKVTGVKVTDRLFGNRIVFSSLATQASIRLKAADRDFPLVVTTPFDVDLVEDYFGGEYGKYTHEGREAIALAAKYAGLKVEGVYTGKALAALIGAYCKEDRGDSVVMFWHTFNSVDLSGIAAAQDYHDLPEEFHQYFECEIEQT